MVDLVLLKLICDVVAWLGTVGGEDAKTLFDAIQTRFGGNNATRKTQKTLLKQMYENFNALSTESLDSIFNWLQKIVSQLAILGENISQEDLTLKFLRMMLYAHDNSPTNVQVSTANSPISTANSPDITANLSDAIIYAFLANQPNRSQLVHKDLEQIYEDDLEEIDLKWQLALLSMRARRGPRNQDNRNRNQDSSRRTVNVEETSSKAMVAIDGASFDWSFMADEEVPTNMALMAFSDSEAYLHPPTIDFSNSGLEEFQQPEFEGYGPKASKSVCKDTSNEVKKTPDAPLGEKLVSEKEKQTIFPTKIESVKQQEKPARKLVKYAEMYRSQKPRGNQRNWNNLKSQQLGGDFVMYNKACFVCGSFDHVQAHCNYHPREGMGKELRRRIYFKGTLKTGKHEFEEVLPNESQVLFKVPRKNNMYSVGMKNIIPNQSLTCLVAKATLDESMLWHRRLGHINFKTINKLVKDNLVRGLLVKHFENDQTCVACLKGKQHKASCDGPKCLFDVDSLTKSMNYVPVVAGKNSNDFAGLEESNGAGHTSKETKFSQDYIVMPLWKDSLMFDSSSKNSSDDEPQPSSNAKKKDDEDMSSMGELNFFLGLQVKQREDGIFISQDKYVAEILRKFGFTYVRTAITPMDIEKPLLKESDGDNVDFHLYKSMIRSLMYLTSSRPYIINSPFDLVAYSDSDYAVASLDRKSTTRGCQFLGCRLISWQCKKQTVVATSSTKAEYVAATSCCRQVLWIQNQMLYYRGANNVNMQSRMNGRTCNIKQRCVMCQTPRQIKRGPDTKIPQSSGPPEEVGDEVVHKKLGDRMERAATIASRLEVEQDSGNNNRTQSMATLNEPSP
ncbi:ribonuclease H-like domain-containing protein [Tanacetum coccineum]